MLIKQLEPGRKNKYNENKWEITLRAARVSAGITEIEAANKINASLEEFKHYEENAEDIPLNNAISLTGLYNIPLDLVYFGKESDYIERKHIL